MADIIEPLIKIYGVPGIIIAALLLVIKVLFNKYDTVMQSRAEDGVKMALAIERSTAATEAHKQAIESVKELIKERRP